MKAAFLALAVLAAAAAPLRADEGRGGNELSLSLGGYGSGSKVSVNGSEDKVGDGGGLLGFRYLRDLDDHVAIGVELNRLDAGSHDSTTLIAHGDSRASLKTTEALAVARVRFGGGKLRPYVLGGLGLHTTTFHLESTPAAGFTWADTGTKETRVLFDDNQAGTALALEGGLDWRFSSALAAAVFASLHYQGRAEYRPTGAGANGGFTPMRGDFGGVGLGATFSARF